MSMTLPAYGPDQSRYVDHSTSQAPEYSMDTAVARQFERLPPASVESEMCLLAAMMLEKDRIPEIRAIIGRDDFFQADHQIIFDVLLDLDQRKRPIDAVIVREELVARHLLEEIGGTVYLAEVFRSVPSAAHVMQYARIVKEKSKLRRVISIANDLLRGAYAPVGMEDGANDLLSKGVNQLTDALISGRTSELVSMTDVMTQVQQQLESGGVKGVKTGFRDLDDMVSCIAYGEMVIVAGRPSMGKSTFARNMAVNIARAGEPIFYVTLEESPLKIGRNLLSAETWIENRNIRDARIKPEEWAVISKGQTQLCDLPIYFGKRCRRISDIYAQLQNAKRKYGVTTLVVDYLQLLNGDGRSMYEKTTQKSNDLCALIKDEDVAGIVLSQLNRGVEGREDHRPNMADLRDSGAIEQDADGIIFVHREDYYHVNDPGYEPTQQAELIIAKWRDGVRGKPVHLACDLRFQRFDDVIT